MTAARVVTQFPIEKEYAKNPQITPADIRTLREWLDRQPHLPSATITDLDLLVTLHCCEQSSEVAKQVLDLHFTLRTHFTGFFENRQVDRRVEKAMNTVLLTPLEVPTADKYRAVYCRLLDGDPRNFVLVDVIRCLLMIYDLWQQEEGTFPGLVLMIDMDRVLMGHLARLDLMTVKQFLYFLQEAMLVRLKEVHFLNAPSFMDKLMMILKPFMKKPLQDMIRIHDVGSDSIEEFVPRAAFPKESGGTYKGYDTLRDEILGRLKANQQYFKDESRSRVDESLRPGKPQTIDSLLGIQGSFKKLDID